MSIPDLKGWPLEVIQGFRTFEEAPGGGVNISSSVFLTKPAPKLRVLFIGLVLLLFIVLDRSKNRPGVDAYRAGTKCRILFLSIRLPSASPSVSQHQPCPSILLAHSMPSLVPPCHLVLFAHVTVLQICC